MSDSGRVVILGGHGKV
ncbi:hypothetical protein, partial [Brevibacterium sp. NPDC056947]